MKIDKECYFYTLLNPIYTLLNPIYTSPQSYLYPSSILFSQPECAKPANTLKELRFFNTQNWRKWKFISTLQDFSVRQKNTSHH